MEKEKKNINNMFEWSKHEIHQILIKNQQSLEKMLDQLYQDALRSFTEIKGLSKEIFN